MILYSKFNNYRKTKFQLITNIEEDNGVIFSSKTAACPESSAFLNSIYDKYEYLQKNELSFKPIKPEKIKKDKLAFKYQNLKTIEFTLLKQLIEKNKENFFEIIKEYITTIKKNKINKEYLTTEFNEIFSPKIFEKNKCELLNVGCIDLNFNNIFINDKINSYFLIDYEWTFDFPIPYKYLVFRAITDFYSRYYLYKPNELVKLVSLYKLANISPKEERKYVDYEYNFQKYVTNTNFLININRKIFYTNYQKLKHNIDSTKYFAGVSKYESKNQNLAKQIDDINQIVSNYQSKNQNLTHQINNLTQEKDKLQSDLNKIQSSKTYKIWQIFNKIKKIIISPFKFIKYIIRPIIFYTKFEFKKIFIKKTKLKYLDEKFTIDGVSFIIPTWNKEEMVVNCINNLIEKLEKEYKDISKEIIVVDNGSEDNTTKSIKSIKSNIPINIISLKKNIGFGPAINLATEKSKYHYIYLLNNDMFPQDGFFSEIINFANNLIKNKKPFFGLSSQIFFYDKTKRREESGKTFITQKFGFINVAHCVNEGNLKDNSITAYPGGGSSLINKYIFKEIGYYDYKSYTPLYCEDLDSGFITWKLGFPNYYVANSHVIHHHRSSSKQLSIDPDFIMHKNWLTFILKNINNKSLYIKHIFTYSLLCVLDKKYREYANEVFKNKNNILSSKLFLTKFKNKYNEKDLINFIDFETKHEF